MTDKLLTESLSAIESCTSSAALEEQRVALLGKKGKLTEALKGLGAASPDERKALGAALNQVKDAITAALEAKKNTLAGAELTAKLASETIDVTQPAPPGIAWQNPPGHAGHRRNHRHFCRYGICRR